MKEYQTHFADLYPDWPRRASVEIKEAGQKVYKNALTLWQNLRIELPKSIADWENSKADSTPFDDKNPLQPSRRVNHAARICDIPIPDEIKPILDLYAKIKKTGDKTTIPSELGDIFLDLYHTYPVEPADDIYGLLPLLQNKHNHDYIRWVGSWWSKWWDEQFGNNMINGWIYRVPNLKQKGDDYFFAFNLGLKLKGIRHWNGLAVEIDYLSPLENKATFRGDYLYSLWQEETNGTFFPDPKGELETIWPYWIKGHNILVLYDADDHSSYPDVGYPYHLDKFPPATEEDWEKYLTDIRDRKFVVSGRTGKLVLQTEKQARENLERWRRYIYNLNPQVFHFHKTATEPGGVGELGYSKLGPLKSKPHIVRKYIPKDPRSYQRLSFAKTLQRVEDFANSLI